MKKLSTCFTLPDLAGLLLALVIFLYGVHQAQLLPHHLRITVGTTVLTDCLVTNPVQVQAVAVRELTPNGFTTKIEYRTNQLWTIWHFFK